MKKFLPLLAALLCGAVLCSCAGGGGGSSSTGRESSPGEPSNFTYNFSFDDLTGEAKKTFKKNIIQDYTEPFTVNDIAIKVEGVSYTRSTQQLQENFYQMPSYATVTDHTVDQEHVIALVQITLTNEADTRQEFYTNNFGMTSLCSLDVKEWGPGDFFYQDSVIKPEEDNRKYARLLLKPGETKEVTVGFLCKSVTLETKNNYVTIGTTGTTSDPIYFVKLPENKEGVL